MNREWRVYRAFVAEKGSAAYDDTLGKDWYIDVIEKSAYDELFAKADKARIAANRIIEIHQNAENEAKAKLKIAVEALKELKNRGDKTLGAEGVNNAQAYTIVSQTLDKLTAHEAVAEKKD